MSGKEIITDIPKPWQIIFICSGNIMRSPYAEFIAKKYIKENSSATPNKLKIKSGGVHYQNEKIHRTVQYLLMQEGFDEKEITDHQPRLIDNYKSYFNEKGIYVAMTNEHRNILITKGKKTVFMLKELTESKKIDILDPYFNPIIAEEIFCDIKKNVKKFVSELINII